MSAAATPSLNINHLSITAHFVAELSASGDLQLRSLDLNMKTEYELSMTQVPDWNRQTERVRDGEREGQREKETDKDRQTDRQKNRHTECTYRQLSV